MSLSLGDPAYVSSLRLAEPWNIVGSKYNGNFFDLSTEDTDPWGFAMSPTGDLTFVSGRQNDQIRSYDLSPSWDISTSLDNVQVGLTGIDPVGYYMRADGDWYATMRTNGILESYDMMDSFEIGTGSFDQSVDFKALVGPDFNPQGVFFSPDGLYIYVSTIPGGTATNNVIWRFPLLFAWDFNSVQSSDSSLDLGVGPASVAGIFIRPDTGDRLYVVDPNALEVRQYILPTPWSLTGAIDAGAFSISGQTSDPRGIWFKQDDGGKWYLIGADNDEVYEYDLL